MTPGIAVRGAAGVATQFSGAGGDTMTGGGGGGDNTFYVSATDNAVAGAGDGIDSVISYWGRLTLAPGFSNGTIQSPGTLTGNARDNILTATGPGAHTLVGGAGHDLLVGAADATDRYVIVQASGGSATIARFKHGADVLELDGFTRLSQFAAVRAAMAQSGADVVLTLGGGQSVTFASQTLAQFTAADFALPLDTTGLRQTFYDGFTRLSASATGVGATWRFMSGTLAANHEAENYLQTAGAGSPFSVAGGVLTITASPVSTAPGLPYTSGGLITRPGFAQTYGVFEMRAQMPAGAGMWPAFWLVPADGSWPPELDAPEVLGREPTIIYLSTRSKLQPARTIAVDVADTSAGFHTYAVDWEPAAITYYFDGNAVASLPTPADMHKPMAMRLNLAVGTAASWPGAPGGETGQLRVGYVRAYASATAGLAQRGR